MDNVVLIKWNPTLYNPTVSGIWLEKSGWNTCEPYIILRVSIHGISCVQSKCFLLFFFPFFFLFNERMDFGKGLSTHLVKATVVWKSEQEFETTNPLRQPYGPFMASRLELCRCLPIARTTQWEKYMALTFTHWELMTILDCGGKLKSSEIRHQICNFIQIWKWILLHRLTLVNSILSYSKGSSEFAPDSVSVSECQLHIWRSLCDVCIS